MGQDKNQLKALLKFLEEIIKDPGNNWFVEDLNELLQDKLRKNPNYNLINQNNLDVLIRLNHNKNKAKARYYYRNIVEQKLKRQLVNDHALMIWYKSIYEIDQYFVHVNYQLENMLNYYLEHTDFHNKVNQFPREYCNTISISEGYKLDIDVSSYSFDKNKGNPIKVNLIKSLWAKILYWAIDTNNMDFLKKQAGNFAAIINIRNEYSHSYYDRKKSASKYWKTQEDDMSFAFIGAILKVVRNSIVELGGNE